MLYIILYIVISLLCISYFSSYKPLGTGKVAVIIATLAVIVGFSDMLGGYDRYIYGELFDRNADLIRAGGSFINPDSPIMGYHKEIAYVFWNSVVAYITPNRYIYSPQFLSIHSFSSLFVKCLWNTPFLFCFSWDCGFSLLLHIYVRLWLQVAHG